MKIMAATDNVTLKVEFYPYERYESTGMRKAKVSGTDLLDALKKMVDHMLLYIDSEEIEDDGLSAKEVIESIISQNGDGCDYITYLGDITSGDVFIDGSDADWLEEDWD